MNKTKRDSRPDLGGALALLVARECRALLRALAMRKRRQEGIHAARKSCRRLRSLLPLLPPGQPSEAVDRGLRELAHGLAPLRDAHMAVQTAQVLAQAHAAWITPEVVRALAQNAEQILAGALSQDPHWRQRRAEARQLIAALQALAWPQIRPAPARKTLKRSRRRMRKARKQALALRSPVALHRWRRRARKLRYQLEFLRKARRMAGMKKRRTQKYGQRATQLSALTDQLGWRQDFQILLATVEQLPDSSAIRALRRKLPGWSQAEPLPARKG